MAKRLSCTQLNMFMRCPRQYEFRYMQGIKIPPAGAMIQGSCYHETLAKEFELQIAGKKPLKAADVGDVFNESWRKFTKGGFVLDETSKEKEEFNEIDWGDDNPAHLKDEGIALSQLYVNEVAGTIKSTAVEHTLEGEIEGIPFILVIDLITSSMTVDHKMKSKRFSYADLTRELQPLAYTLPAHVGVKDYPGVFGYHVALKQKTPQIITPSGDPNLLIRPTEGDYLWFTGIVKSCNSAISAGVFYPSPNGWHCTPKFCGYWSMCRGKMPSYFDFTKV